MRLPENGPPSIKMALKRTRHFSVNNASALLQACHSEISHPARLERFLQYNICNRKSQVTTLSWIFFFFFFYSSKFEQTFSTCEEIYDLYFEIEAYAPHSRSLRGLVIILLLQDDQC